MLPLKSQLSKIARGDLFKWKDGKPATGRFVGRPFGLTYDRTFLLVADKWKQDARGLPQGAFLLAYYENETDIQEALLLRVLLPAELPTDGDVIRSMIEYYKDNLKTAGKESQLDTYTRYEFSFSGLECRILGTFYREGKDGEVRFGADVENFYSAHNYTVVKPDAEALRFIVNFRDGSVAGKPSDIRIGRVRYSSSRRFQSQEEEVEVFVSPQDFLGKRTALFGMTRTGKSNTVKKIIQASVRMSGKARYKLASPPKESDVEKVEPYTSEGLPKYPVGQIVFDINGEYANANLQDQGTAIFEMYKELVTRYSVREKPGFKVMKVNFYQEVQAGFELIHSALAMEGADYARSFLAVDLAEPEDKTDFSAVTRYDRVRAAYLCCLFRAGFKAPRGFQVKFTGNKEINANVKEGGLDPAKGLTLEEACDWFTWVWDNYDSGAYFADYRNKKGREWADEDLKAVLKFLTRKTSPGGNASVSGFLKLRPLQPLHTDTVDKPFEQDIIERLRVGEIILVDLSQGDPDIQRLYSERICRAIFADAMARFVDARPNNFLQFYFEEAHNLFPRKDDKDLGQIYNRIAKEGAKLHLGLVYATQEVSSISGNILKNTQNWFIAHLNNEDETKEIRKYYDFGDFTEGLVRFSATDDKGFVRMKTYSNPFVVPVQIDRFQKEE
jgi:hypothetical protein